MLCLFTDVILCNFEEDLCNWDQKLSSNYKWGRITGQMSSDDGLGAPAQDLNGDTDKYFLYVFNDSGETSEEKRSRTWITSPQFKSSEHPLECLSFWFQFNVGSCTDSTKINRLGYNICMY